MNTSGFEITRCEYCQTKFISVPIQHQKHLCVYYVSIAKINVKLAEEVWQALKSDDEKLQDSTIERCKLFMKTYTNLYKQ